jgi:hypothetical protein
VASRPFGGFGVGGDPVSSELHYAFCDFCEESPVFESRRERNRWEMAHDLECEVMVWAVR